ncbi:aspartate aminotransferase family protein [Vibrio sp.]|uniref:class-III pyridoxal-phosphate-dependent aminotransferase n=1 Tax=Vibrio sp. TaxID=678 RepID=UPI003D0BC5CA
MSKLIYTGLNAGKNKVTKVVGGQGVYFHLEDGRKVLDGSNTGGPLGHQHPRMVEAMVDAARRIPVINEGWFWAEREKAAEELIDFAFAGEDWVGGVRFFLSGSEANDLALSFAQAYTGRTALATRDRAYHGMTGLSLHMTVQPHWHGGLSVADGNNRPVPTTFDVKTLPAPISAVYGGQTPPASMQDYLAGAEELLSDTAATIIDYTQGGKYYLPEYQDLVANAARKAGSLWIADEVVTGLGRHGKSMFAFQGGKTRPDIVTLGKPIGGGAMPGGAVVLSKDIMDDMNDKSWQTYSTFRGHPMQVAATRAYLDVLKTENLLAHVCELETQMHKRLVDIAESHPAVSRVDGRGLHWTVELHGPDWRNWQIATGSTPIASKVANRALELGAMIGTSGEQTSLFLAPPLIISAEQLDELLSILDEALLVADAEYQADREAVASV